jgi:voltage-gated sodium channel
VSLREKVQRVVEARSFQHTIMAVIILNAATLGVATSPHLTDRTGALLDSLDKAAIAIFVVELLAKLYAYRLRFFRDPWNIFDFLVVGVALVPAASGFSVLRALRLLRMLRLVSMIPSMRRVVATLLAAIPGAASILALLGLVIYVSAVMATTLFGARAPQHFGNLGESLWTLFQTLTGEAWPEIADDVIAEYPGAWVFFLVFILISTFVVLNLFLAVIVGAMESVRDSEEAHMDAALDETESDLKAELAELRQEIRALRGLLEQHPSLDRNRSAATAAASSGGDEAD